ncbi:alpha/beta fold hydrolase [Paracoccus tegillarcae]|nr:alpha/beta hydrolase [Paracoccus tegillarcae]
MTNPLAAAVIACAVWPLAFATSAETISINGADLTMVSDGEGPAVLFVHGAISDHRVWAPYRERIARSNRFLAYDQRYFGLGDWPDDGAGFSADAHAADLISLIETLDTGPVSLVSWSYGGDVAARAAVARPELFHALIFYEPDIRGLIDGLPGADESTQMLYDRLGPAFVALEDGRPEDAALGFIDGVFDLPQGGAAQEPAEWQAVWRENSRTIPPFVSAEPGDIASCEDLSGIDGPSMIVRGTNTLDYDAMMSETAARCLSNAIIVEMQGVNHDGPYRDPDRFGDMIENFVAITQ